MALTIRYTEEEVETITKAWRYLERLVETNISWEICVTKALAYEMGIRKDVTNARILIMREMCNHKSIAKHAIFYHSTGIRDCIVLANHMFHNQDNKLHEFKELAIPAILAHEEYMERLYAAANL